MTTYTLRSHPTDPMVALLDVDGARYVIRADLGYHSRDGFYEQRTSTCRCCNQATYSSGNRYARDITELLELGWAMTEQAYEEWKTAHR